MNIKTCGRCGDTYEEFETPSEMIIKIPDIPSSTECKEIPLCPACRSEFIKFLGGTRNDLCGNSQAR